MSDNKQVAVIVGAGPGLGAAAARRFTEAGMTSVLVSRNAERLADLAASIDGAVAYPCDATDEDAVEKMFTDIEAEHGPVEVLVYNPGGGFGRTTVVEQSAERFRAVWEFTAFGGFLCSRAAAQRMLKRGHGSILITGATASLRGGKGFGAFASGKFALRALGQSMARELGPEGIHVAQINIDGMIGESDDGSKLDPADIAETYYGLHKQSKTNWTHELDIRPWSETW
ncbi:MAG: SDR family NAD(P)-dependent oxidoreductase [Rhodospirillaceae bacterium]|jgi:NAD(P)-dependent dehydrogenase (short-subunit alcohol dehydrogenase family)|nr:SDR family NAD(P)-dependent oxidoreductase [Rhodospirillaceae bacterium]MBT5240604.1 SDR family NAD(P)-dependent oxidoreductase [Rhodospirillaceae bacterium]MBT5564438.1 SDR family NAD(P)-dependent oxidoreductase [Rhodospirillaceae bacterium]MBT6089729.1 SDR family NAD(P)-dependent oxidoreductase [Rhodospirillaceae bacterium]